MKKRFSTKAYVLAGLSFGGCLTPSQKPEEIFADRKELPKALDRFANPRPSSSQLSRGFGDPRSRIDVAIIDNGVDYLHPDLIKQIRFDRGANGGGGAGLDVMGGDRWPHPNVIDAKLFAFGAGAIKDGLIQGAQEDPIKFIAEMNAAFMKQLETEIQADPVLKKSLFRKINAANYDIFAAGEFAKEWSPRRYEQLKKLELLITETTPPEKDAPFRDHLTWRTIVELGWADVQEVQLVSVEHADLFEKAVRKALAPSERSHGFSKHIENYKKFHKDRDPDSEGAIAPYGDIGSGMRELANHFPKANPEQSVATHFCQRYDAETYALVTDPKVPLTRKIASAKAFLERQIKLTEEVLSIQEKIEKSPEELHRLSLARKALPFFRRYFDSVMDRKDQAFLFCDPKLGRRQPDARIAKFAKDRFHPYLAAGADEEVHGTHVAGIVARQSRKTQIVPVRVITSSTQDVPAKKEALRKELERDFADWLASPVALKGAEARLRSIGGSGRAGVEAVMRRYLDEFWASDSLDVHFFDEIIQAIRYVGEQKIKLANMSLGTNFTVPVDSATRPSPRDVLKREGKFILYEFFKTRIAEAVNAHAPGTLFVIASGNDGQWVDGRSHSALPCDITSSYMKQFEADPSRPTLANNAGFRNILCVGSINSRDELSSFMNLPLTSTPFVLSYGESVLAPVKATSCDGTTTQLVNENGVGSTFPMPFVDTESGDFDAFGKKYGFIRAGDKDEDLELARGTVDSEIMYAGVLLTSLGQAEFYRRCFETTAPRNHLSGTSMATPAVTGYLARKISAYLRVLNVEQDKAYADPRFSPAAIVKMLGEKSPVFGGDSIIKSLPKVVDIRTWGGRVPTDKLKAAEATPVIDIRAAQTFLDGDGI